MTSRQLLLLRKAELAIWLSKRFSLPSGGGDHCPDRWRGRASRALGLGEDTVKRWLTRDGIESNCRDEIEEKAIALGFRSVYDAVAPDSVRHHLVLYESIVGTTARLTQPNVEQLAAAFHGVWK